MMPAFVIDTVCCSIAYTDIYASVYKHICISVCIGACAPARVGVVYMKSAYLMQYSPGLVTHLVEL